MEAVVKQARTTSHLWLVACDANMDSSEFRRGMWFKEECRKNSGAEVGVSTCRSTRQKGELIKRTYDYVITGKSVEGKINNLKVVEDLGSRPHTTVTFHVEKDTCAS